MGGDAARDATHDDAPIGRTMMATHTALTMRASVAARPTTAHGKTTTTTHKRGALQVLGAASKAKKNRDLDRLRDLANAEETLLVAGFNYQGLTVRVRTRSRVDGARRGGVDARDGGRCGRASHPRGLGGRPRARRGEGDVTASGDARDRWDIISIGRARRRRRVVDARGRWEGRRAWTSWGWLRVLGLGTTRAGGGGRPRRARG